MSNVVPNKVDMSLDDIIKLTKVKKEQQGRIVSRRGRGRGNRAQVGYEIPRGGAGANYRGRGAGVRQTVNPIKQFRSNLQNSRRGWGRGRGRGINRQSTGVRRQTQTNTNQQNVRGRIRGRGGRGASLVFTNSRVTQQTGQQLAFVQQQSVQQRQRLNKVRQQAALLREQKLAIQNLQQAQKNVQSINMAIQKTSRENVVNQLRGINTIQTGQPGGRGRRKMLSLLKRQGNNSMLNNSPPTRQLNNTSVTISNLSATSTVSNFRGKRRRWRKNNNQVPASDHFTIQVANQNLQPVRKQNSILNELKTLKPAVTTTYKFEKSVFAAPATGVSLNDRFSSTSFNDGGDSVAEDRKVFI